MADGHGTTADGPAVEVKQIMGTSKTLEGDSFSYPEMEAINALKNIKKEKVDPINLSYLNQFREICYVPYVSKNT